MSGFHLHSRGVSSKYGKNHITLRASGLFGSSFQSQVRFRVLMCKLWFSSVDGKMTSWTHHWATEWLLRKHLTLLKSEVFMKYFFTSESENSFTLLNKFSSSKPFWSYTSYTHDHYIYIYITSLKSFSVNTLDNYWHTAHFCPKMALNLCDYNSNRKWHSGSKTSLLEPPC